MEPLRADILARLALTQAMHKRPRPADMPCAVTHEISIDLRTGARTVAAPRLEPTAQQANPFAPPERKPGDRECAHCGAPFMPRTHNQRYCDATCHYKHWRPGYAQKTCVFCGKKYSAAVHTQMYCSRTCRQRQAHRLRFPEAKPRKPKVPSIPLQKVEKICAIVGDVFRVPLEVLMGPSRMREVAVPRHAAMALAHALLPLSMSQVGRAFHRDDHTTVMNALRRNASRTENSPTFAERYRLCDARCRAALGVQPSAQAVG